ncbi:MAG TPA: NAD(P)/FAD-dependent oxidoreductase [Fimbriimonadaceae bacterium]|nr:NAD(P)/FAD-dependent oxidoreductase [Fimbriimonadaceae bacterium]
MSTEPYDVAIIGGGPSGSTLGTLLRKYCPGLRVLLLEREKFPRDHVGESLLPVACRVLDSMGCWDAVEAGGFPVKVGATYRWGSTDDLWDFDFLAGQSYEDVPRPAKYDGQRRNTAFQVDRSLFDTILLNHARERGVEVREEAKVVEVLHAGDAVTGLKLEDGSTVHARYTVDATGHSGLVRRALGVEVVEPSALKNIAVWRYWHDADWAVTIGASGTRVQVLSLGWGWIWVIPITPTRTSIGLVLPAEYYRKSGRRPEELYAAALEEEPSARQLVHGATVEPEVHTTKDWSFIASRMAGENWFLVGESAGFADPILAAGISLAMVGAQEAAITIAELDRGKLDSAWLKREFERSQVRRIKTHIQFADYWYTANARFSDLIEFTGQIASESGVPLKGKEAWQWLGTGGFVQMGGAGVAGFTLAGTRWLVNAFERSSAEWQVEGCNMFALNLDGATKVDVAIFHEGAIEPAPALSRDGKLLPARGVYRFLVQALSSSNRLDHLLESIRRDWCPRPEAGLSGMAGAIEALEAMVNDGWVAASCDPAYPVMNLDDLVRSNLFRPNTDNFQPATEQPAGPSARP